MRIRTSLSGCAVYARAALWQWGTASTQPRAEYTSAMATRAPYRFRGLLHPACGPILQVEVHGLGDNRRFSKGLAVIDTGAMMSALDKGVAHDLELATHGVARFFAVTDTGGEHPVSPTRRAALRIAQDKRLWELDFIEVPDLAHVVEGFHVVALLGWDFLNQCRLELDGPSGTFTLELPRIGGGGRRRR